MSLHRRRNNSSLHCPLALPCKQGRFYFGEGRIGNRNTGGGSQAVGAFRLLICRGLPRFRSIPPTPLISLQPFSNCGREFRDWQTPSAASSDDQPTRWHEVRRGL